MRELGQFDAIFLAQRALIVPAFLDVVYLDRLVAGRRHTELSVIVVVERLDMGLWLALLDVFAFEKLCGDL